MKLQFGAWADGLDVASSRSRKCAARAERGQQNCMVTRTRAWACYGTPWQQLGRFRDVY